MNVANEEQLYQVVGNNIRKYRLNAKLRQADLAAKIGISRTSIINIEQGRQNVSLYLLLKIVECLDVNVQDMLPNRIDSPKPDVSLREVSKVKDTINDDAYHVLVDFMNSVKAKNNVQ